MSKPKMSKAELASRCDLWREQPWIFMKEILDIDCTPNQIDILKSLQKDSKVSIKGCNSSGKSFLFSAYILSWFFTHLTISDKVICCFAAPQFSQLKTGLYAGLKARIKKANKKIQELTGDKNFKIFPKPPSEDQNRAEFWYSDESYIIGISAKSANEIAGRHGDYVLVIFDECQGISTDVYSGFVGLTQSGVVTEVMLGNTTLPDGNAGVFYDSFSETSEFKQITITSFQTPNFVMPNIKLEDYFKEESDKDYWRNKLDRYCGTNYEQTIKTHGKKTWESQVMNRFGNYKALANPVGVNSILTKAGFNVDDYEVKTRVLAEFPDSAGAATYPTSWIQNSVQKYNNPIYHNIGKIFLGLDFGRGLGKDKTSFCITNGNKVILIKEFELDTQGILDKTQELYNQYAVDLVKLEQNGEGIHFERLLKQMGLNVYGIDVGSAAGFPKTNNWELKQYTEDIKRRVTIKRDELWWNLRLKLDPVNEIDGGEIFLLPPDIELHRQMKASSYRYNDRKLISVTKKDELREKLKRSTDTLDSLLLAIAPYEDIGYNQVNPDNFKWFSIKAE